MLVPLYNRPLLLIMDQSFHLPATLSQDNFAIFRVSLRLLQVGEV